MLRLKSAMHAQRDRLLGIIEQPGGGLAVDALRLASHVFSVRAGAIAEIALALEAEAGGAPSLTGVPEIDWLRTGQGKPPEATPVRPGVIDSPERPLRRLARVASWTTPVRMVNALLRPDAIAISHNTLLQSTIQSGRHAVGFRHADSWLSSILSGTRAQPADEGIARIAGEAAWQVAGAIGVDELLTRRAAVLLESHLRMLMEEAARHLGALRDARLPSSIWAGTGGNWSSRAIGLEVLRRGGAVRRFDHGGSLGTIDDCSGLRLIELASASEYTLPTGAVADLVNRQMAPGRAHITGGRGDPHFAPAPGRVRSRRSMPRVLYATTASLGFRRLMPLNMPDAVYIDWQLRIARILSELDIELILKPHPEGLFRGQRHPLEGIAPVERGGFESALDSADLAIFDYAASTTFWATLVTNCPVIFLDNGLVDFDPLVRDMLADRARILPVGFDDENRPCLDRHTFVDAVLNPVIGDPAPFRALLGGEEKAPRQQSATAKISG